MIDYTSSHDIIERMSDKEEEKKYCQENFNSEGETTIGLIVGIPIAVLVVAVTAFLIWSYFKYDSEATEK
jgi:hypothetical protein